MSFTPGYASGFNAMNNAIEGGLKIRKDRREQDKHDMDVKAFKAAEQEAEDARKAAKAAEAAEAKKAPSTSQPTAGVEPVKPVSGLPAQGSWAARSMHMSYGGDASGGGGFDAFGAVMQGFNTMFPED